MGLLNKGLCYVTVIIAIVTGLLFGIAEALLWFFGLIPFIRDIIPYATADALLIVALTVFIVLFSNPKPIWHCNDPCKKEDPEKWYGCPCLYGYVKAILIAAAIFLIFIQIFIGATLPFAAKVILAFIGSTSFWTMLTTFIGLVFCTARNR